MLEREQLIHLLDNPDASAEPLKALNLREVERAHSNFVAIAELGLTLDLLALICDQLAAALPELSDPDMALNNLERFFAASRNPLSLGALFERDSDALPTLLQIFSSSQHLSDLLITDPESFDLLRLTEGQPVSRRVLIGEICDDVDTAANEQDVMTLLRRHKQRETLRIAYGDIIRRQRVQTVTEQISFLADALVEAAYRAALRKMVAKRGRPRRRDDSVARFAVLAMGKLGGTELNYSSDIDLIFLCDDGTKTDGERSVSNVEFFDGLARLMVKYLSEKTELGDVYRVDLRLRPEGSKAPLVISLGAALHYYDMKGRTWERQAFIKARTIAGSADLGDEVLTQLEPWIYRRYLGRVDISGIKALKRRIENRAIRDGCDASNVKEGHGGIRDIEFAIQFLQLVNGGDLQEIRTGNTLEAIARLAEAGCLTFEERTSLINNYTMLRSLEHRLQIMFNLQTHTLPDDDDELAKLAIRMGYKSEGNGTPLSLFKEDYALKTDQNRRILNHLLQDAFGSDEPASPEVDLVLDPDPSEAFIHEVLDKYGFAQVEDAYKNLMALTTEKISFLSTRRCRFFLASIANDLLRAIADTPDPDSTLISLSKVSDSLGGKGVLWELFSSSPPSLQLYVRLCGAAPYLSSILTSHPGMIDELMDSLILDKLPTHEGLHRTLVDLLYGADDPDLILHGFKNSLHLRVGVRDILGKEDIRNTHRVLSDVAEVCLKEVALREYDRLVEKYGVPTIHGGERDGEACEMVILAMGKLGGREPNYHSDLDVVFVYEGDGSTRQPSRSRSDKTTTNQHFFSQLGQRLIKVINFMGPFGRLYELDPRLRPTGKNGLLAVSLDEFRRYFDTGQGQLWERQALLKARPIYGSNKACDAAMNVVRYVITGLDWQPSHVAEIRNMRQRMEQNVSKRNLKRGPGGTVDVEFVVQMLQLKHAAQAPEVLVSGTLAGIEALRDAGRLEVEDAEYLLRSYRFLRSVEARLRLMNTTARHEIPEDERELTKLAYLLVGCDSGSQLRADYEKCTNENRCRFNRLFDAAERS